MAYCPLASLSVLCPIYTKYRDEDQSLPPPEEHAAEWTRKFSKDSSAPHFSLSSSWPTALVSSCHSSSVFLSAAPSHWGSEERKKDEDALWASDRKITGFCGQSWIVRRKYPEKSSYMSAQRIASATSHSWSWVSRQGSRSVNLFRRQREVLPLWNLFIFLH